jgi:hypothetical protein
MVWHLHEDAVYDFLSSFIPVRDLQIYGEGEETLNMVVFLHYIFQEFFHARSMVET